MHLLVKIFLVIVFIYSISCGNLYSEFNEDDFISDMQQGKWNSRGWDKQSLMKVIGKHFVKGEYYRNLPVRVELLAYDGTETGHLLHLVDTTLNSKKISVVCESKDLTLSDEDLVWNAEDADLNYRLFVGGRMDSIGIMDDTVVIYFSDFNLED